MVWLLFALALFTATTGSADEKLPDSAEGGLPFLMAEDFEDLDFCAWRIEPGQPDPHNPLVEPAMPWDAGGVLAHGSVKRDPIDGLWKAWQVSIPRPTTKAGTQDPSWWRPALTYLESKDGVNWERPKLNLIAWEGQHETNLLTDGYTTYASVNIDPARKDAPYEMFAFRMPGYLGAQVVGGPKVIDGLPLPPGKDKHPYGVYRFRSRDGKEWKAVEGPLTLETADCCQIYRLTDGTYVCYHKTEMPAFPGGLTPWDVDDGGVRLIGRRTSKDGSHWSDPTAIVMSPDWRDPADTQMMELGPLAVPGGYVATLTVYHNFTQTIDLQWAASRDGINWWRPERRPSLANAPLGDFGGGMIWPMHSPVMDGDQLHVYYDGTEGLHGDLYNTKASGPRVLRARGEILSRQSFNHVGDYGALCRATWTADRLWALVSAHGGYTEGAATTRRADLAGKQLVVNATTRPGGTLRVELLGGDGRTLPGFTAADCEAVEGDHHGVVVHWKGGDRAPAGAAKTRFLIRQAFLYGLAWQDAMIPAGFSAEPKKTSILHSELVLPPDEKQTYEACLFPLEEGRLALFHDLKGVLSMRVSADRGRTWGASTPLQTVKGEKILGNRTSPVRLASGAIGLFHTDRPHVLRGRDGPLRFRVSKDEGKTWSEGVFVNPIFAVQRNGTARVISQGRIVSPVFVWLSSLAGGESENTDNSTCYGWTYTSDDEGATWNASESQLLVRQNKGRGGYYSFEEPCIEELDDGRLIMLGRTELGRQFVSYSKDRGVSWSEPAPAPLASAYAPAFLIRVPKTKDLLCIWNQVSPDEILGGLHRRRLSCAVSSDDGKTWKHFRNLESRDATTYIEPPPVKVYRMEDYHYAEGPTRICYPSVAFLGDEAAICYDYGEMDKDGKGKYATKLVVLPIKWFYEE